MPLENVHERVNKPPGEVGWRGVHLEAAQPVWGQGGDINDKADWGIHKMPN